MYTYSGPGPDYWPAMTSIPPKPRMRQIGDQWHAWIEDAEGFCGAIGKDAHQVYAWCMRTAGWRVPHPDLKFVPPELVDLPVGVA